MSMDLVEVELTALEDIAVGIKALEFRRRDGRDLPNFTAGAHVNLHLPAGLVRSYSLCNDQTERDRYVVAVSRDASSRGGSTFIHDNMKVGDAIKISAPHNNFELIEHAPHTVFVAGGIGITPIWSMIQRLEALNKSWELYYSVRTRPLCAFKRELEQAEKERPGRVHINFDHEPGAKQTDLPAILSKLSPETHLYCCGPKPMLAALTEAASQQGICPDRVHIENFSASEAPATEGGFAVVVQSTGESLHVPAGKSILDVLLDHGVDVAYSCMEGTCGTCETVVIEGEPDHRDVVLTQTERESNRTIMVCCSGSKSKRLVLDL